MKYIDAEQFKWDNERLLHCDFPYLSEETLEELIDNAPAADVVEVVRCKDCKYGDAGTDEIGRQFYKCIGIHYGSVSPTDYCSYGERKGERNVCSDRD